MKPLVLINPHFGMGRVVHAAFVPLGAQPLPVSQPQGLSRICPLLFRIHNGVGGKKGHLGVVGNDGGGPGLGQGPDTLGAVFGPEGLFFHKFHRIAQSVPDSAPQQTATVAALHRFPGIFVLQRPEFPLFIHPHRERAAVKPLGRGKLRNRRLPALGAEPLDGLSVKLPVQVEFRPHPELPALIVGQVQKENAGFSSVGVLSQNLEMRILACGMQPPVCSMFKGGKIGHVVGKDHIPVGCCHSHEPAAGVGKGLFPDNQAGHIIFRQFLRQVHIPGVHRHAGIHFIHHGLELFRRHIHVWIHSASPFTTRREITPMSVMVPYSGSSSS